MEYADGGTSIT